MRRFFFVLCGLWAGAAGAEITAPGTAFFDYGFFCAVEIIGHEEAQDTISGVVNMVAETPEFQRRSAIIPAEIGIGFGVHADVLPGYDGQAVIVNLHPPMGPDGVTRESWTTTYTAGEVSYNGFTFEYDYELVTGPWQISATSNGRLIYRIDFEVVDPALLPKLSCDGALLS